VNAPPPGRSPFSLRTLATRPWGRALLIAVAILAVAWSFIYLGEVIAIGAFLLLGLILPIYFGWKRPRQLAIAGLVVLLLAAPISAALETNLIRTPVPAAASATTLPDGNGGSVLQNASVGPFNGASGTNFTFVVDVYPQYLPPNTSLRDVVFVVSTCPTATGNQSSPYCSAGYPFFLQNRTFPTSPNATFELTFHQQLPGPDIWWWTMYAQTQNSSGGYHTTFLQAGQGYSTIEGPVTGAWTDIFGIVVGQVYLYMFLYLGIVYYLALLAYTWFKVRESKRKSASGIPPAPAAPSTSAGGSSGPASAQSAPSEEHCPKCNAVVYPNESQCWKCGTPLRGPGSATPSAAPLPSGGPPPPTN
jgi:hypothetical protein